jgi:beta-galactosidase
MQASSIFTGALFFALLGSGVAFPQALAARPSSSVAQVLQREPLLAGVAWYPEQWPESRWEQDLTLMEQAHLHVVRVAEFAWSTMEPAEGQFEFGWLDRAIALAAKHNIKVVLGTPTAAPPAWLTEKYPDTLRVDEDGRRAEHGNRQQFSRTLPTDASQRGSQPRWPSTTATTRTY